MDDAPSALRALERGGNREPHAELAGRTRPSFAEALNLRRMQGRRSCLPFWLFRYSSTLLAR
jgi:hypothetical protein